MDGWGNPDDRGNPDCFFAEFHRPDYPDTPVYRVRLEYRVRPNIEFGQAKYRVRPKNRF